MLDAIDAAHRVSCCRCQCAGESESEVVPVLRMALELGLPCLVLQKIAKQFPNDMQSSFPLPLHFLLSHYTPEDDAHAVDFLLYLIECNPCAAKQVFLSKSGTHSKTLNMAIRNGYAWKSMYALEQIIRAAPCVLSEVDESTNLLPFQVAASTQCYVDETIQTEAIYRLLRFEPSVMQG
jgi:hypothetical protein